MTDPSRPGSANWNAYAALAVDLLPMAVLLLTPTGELLWANHRASLMLRDGDVIRMERRTVAAASDDDPILHAELTKLADERNQGGESRVRFFRLKRGGNHKTYQAALVDARALTLEPTGTPAALLVIHDPSAAAICDRTALVDLYGFTRAETAVAEKLMTGRNLKDIANESGVSTHTVRAHLKRLFAKTNTTRQAELVLLLGSGVAGLQYARQSE